MVTYESLHPTGRAGAGVRSGGALPGNALPGNALPGNAPTGGVQLGNAPPSSISARLAILECALPTANRQDLQVLRLLVLPNIYVWLEAVYTLMLTALKSGYS